MNKYGKKEGGRAIKERKQKREEKQKKRKYKEKKEPKKQIMKGSE